MLKLFRLICSLLKLFRLIYWPLCATFRGKSQPVNSCEEPPGRKGTFRSPYRTQILRLGVRVQGFRVQGLGFMNRRSGFRGFGFRHIMAAQARDYVQQSGC